MAQQLFETDRKALLTTTINEFFERSIEDATAVDSSYRQLWEVMYGLVRSGGKRLRPYMTILAYEAFGGKDVEKVMPVAAAQELLHFSLLIHDDVIDRDYTRYGTLNVAGRYKIAYSKFINNETDLVHYSHGAAILGGDLMLSAAYQLIASSQLSEQQKITSQNLLSQSIFEVAGGELLDTESSFVPYTDGNALKIARYKTASYSFVIPLLTGAKLADASSEQLKVLEEFALTIGTAFQLVDDLLGVFGEEETTGKSITSDISEGKRTFMVEQAIAAMTTVEKAAFEKVFGKHDATSDEIESVKQMLVSTGAKQATERMIQTYKDAAYAALPRLSLDKDSHDKFEQLIKKVTERAF